MAWLAALAPLSPLARSTKLRLDHRHRWLGNQRLQPIQHQWRLQPQQPLPPPPLKPRPQRHRLNPHLVSPPTCLPNNPSSALPLPRPRSPARKPYSVSNMPVVPMNRQQAPTEQSPLAQREPPAPPFVLMAAAQMHDEGRLMKSETGEARGASGSGEGAKSYPFPQHLENAASEWARGNMTGKEFRDKVRSEGWSIDQHELQRSRKTTIDVFDPSGKQHELQP